MKLFVKHPGWLHRCTRTWAACTVVVTLCLGHPGSSQAQTTTIARSQEVLPIAAALVERLELGSVDPAELIAGAESQFSYFFPGGLNSAITTRTQLDALVASTLLLEEGIRRGAGAYRQARTLFECYFLMYQAGRAGMLSQTFELLRQEAGQQSSQEDLEIIDIYGRSIDLFEVFGRESSELLGNLLLLVRPDDTEIAYALSHIAEQSGDYPRAARLYQHGLQGVQYARRLLAFSELQAAAGLSGDGDTTDAAVALEPGLVGEIEPTRQRIELRREMARLERSRDSQRLSQQERFELATALRRAGRLVEALELFESLSDWRDAPPELVEEHAIAVMEANLPVRMRDLMATTRSRTDVSARLLQLRLVANSLQLVSAAASSEGGIRLSDYLATEAGSDMSADLEAFAAMDPTRARFVRVYLELVTALVALRLSGTLEESWYQSIRSQVEELIEAQPDDVAGQRFRLMLALYTNDRDGLYAALDGYGDFCREHDCEPEHRRISAMVLLQMAAREGDLTLLERVDRMVRTWPEDQQLALVHLVRGTARLIRARLAQTDQSGLEQAYQQAGEEFQAGIEVGLDHAATPETAPADFAGLYNNLAYLALERHDGPAAGLLVYGARRYAPNHPAILLNLGVSLAICQNIDSAFLNFTLAATEAMMDPALTFQMLRWAGHIYNLAGQQPQAVDTYRRALALYESGQDWAASVDDGIFSGGPVEWGLVYDDTPGQEGLAITLDLASSPLFYVPAPVSVLEMSAATENVAVSP